MRNMSIYKVARYIDEIQRLNAKSIVLQDTALFVAERKKKKRGRGKKR